MGWWGGGGGGIRGKTRRVRTSKSIGDIAVKERNRQQNFEKLAVNAIAVLRLA